MTREDHTERQRTRYEQWTKRRYVITVLLPELGIPFEASTKPRSVEKARRKQLWKNLQHERAQETLNVQAS